MMHFLTYSLLSALLIFSKPLMAKETITPSDANIGKNMKAKQYSDIYFSGQPDLNDLKELRRQGFSTIINLRTAGELNLKEQQQASKTEGLNYYHLPFSPDQTLDDAYIESVTKAVTSHRKEGKVLIHCGSGNRAGMWAGAHFFKDHKFNKSDAVKMSEALGIGNQGKEKLSHYLKSKQDRKSN